MKKLFLLLVVGFAGYLFYQFEQGDIAVESVANVFGAEEIAKEIDPIEFEINGSDRVFALIVSPDASQSEMQHQIFSEVAEIQRVDQVVVVGENHLRRGFYNAAFSEMSALIGESENDNFGESERAFWEENVLRPIEPLLKENFPDADVHGILLKDFIADEDVDELAIELAENLDENSLVVISTHFTSNMDTRVANFQDEMAENVLTHMDTAGIEDLNVDSRPSVRLLFGYLQAKGAQKAELEASVSSETRTHFFGKFYEGEPDIDRDLTIMAFGDMMLGRYVRTLMNENGMDYIFRDIQGEEKRFFSGADVIFGNLEGPIKGEGRSGGTSMVFAFNRDIGPLLALYNFNLMSIANNHAFDAGQEGREETIEVLEENDIGWCGHSTEVDPESVYYDWVGDHSYAFVCFDDVKGPIDDDAAVAMIKEIRPNVDYLIVSVHWGPEYYHSPHNELQVQPGRSFIDAGADFVIGHHPHVVQTFEEYNGKLIFYSLGNFVFDQYWSQKTQEQMGIGIVLDDADEDEGFSTKVYLFPMRSVASQSYLMTGSEKAQYLEKFIGYGDYSEEMQEMIRNGIVEVNN